MALVESPRLSHAIAMHDSGGLGALEAREVLRVLGALYDVAEVRADPAGGDFWARLEAAAAAERKAAAKAGMDQSGR